MRILIQRVSEAHVKVDNQIVGAIQKGLLVLVGIEETDTEEDSDWLAQKTVGLRVFPDNMGVMNESLLQQNGQLLVISQFTLHAQTKKGNRPSYIRAARPEQAIPLYEHFLKTLATLTKQKVARGVFGADMKVQLINDGPVTIWIDSKNRE
ncbi:MAG: D-tyrosyl-tRNA(Tyr) deacylase [Flavobacterium sp. BFFFF2]|nr:MAG: D-tyrosyl-tRNA(Tyr) deacylase [Flavobacterium sp. BFFFF2]